MGSSKRGKVVFIGGIWDLFHVGHLNILKSAKELGDRLVVGVLSDFAASRYKRSPIMTCRERVRIVQAISVVDEAIIQLDTDPTKFGELQAVKPDILVHGDDWDAVPGQEWMERNGKEIVFLPYTQGISTTEIIERIKDRNQRGIL